MLFDGDRFWFVDWEAAFLNDRYVDLAVVGNFAAHDTKAEVDYLRAYFDREPTVDERARFLLVSQLMHVYYAAFLLVLVRSTHPDVEVDVPADDFARYHRRLLTGDATFTTPEGKVQYALCHLDRAVARIKSRRFRGALRAMAAPS